MKEKSYGAVGHGYGNLKEVTQVSGTGKNPKNILRVYKPVPAPVPSRQHNLGHDRNQRRPAPCYLISGVARMNRPHLSHHASLGIILSWRPALLLMFRLSTRRYPVTLQCTTFTESNFCGFVCGMPGPVGVRVRLLPLGWGDRGFEFQMSWISSS